MHTQTQMMAGRAFARVSARVQERKTFEDYASYAKSLPTLIQTSGLCQAIAFAQAKSYDTAQRPTPWRFLIEDLVAVCALQSETAQPGDAASGFAERVRTEQLSEYMRLTRTCIAAASWLKRYAEALEKQPSAAPPAR
jgi:CRISPR-associated protein Cmr5